MGAVAGAIASGRVPAGGVGRRPVDQLGQPDLDPRRRARRRRRRLPRRRLPRVGRPPPRRRRRWWSYFRRRAIAAAVVAGVVAFVGIFVLRADARYLFDGLTATGAAARHPLRRSAASASLVLLVRDAHRGARILAIGAVASVVVGWGVAQWPYILPTSLTVADAAAPSGTLTALLVATIASCSSCCPASSCSTPSTRRACCPAKASTERRREPHRAIGAPLDRLGGTGRAAPAPARAWGSRRTRGRRRATTATSPRGTPSRHRRGTTERAPAMIWLAYCGYCVAVSAALENDFVSSDCTLLLTADGTQRAPPTLAYPAVRSAPKIDCMTAPPKIALQVGGTRRHPGPPHRHRPRQRTRRRGTRQPDADADEGVAEADLPVRRLLVPQQQHREEPEEHEHVAEQEREIERHAPRRAWRTAARRSP